MEVTHEVQNESMRTVKAHELTVQQIRDFMSDETVGDIDLIAETLNPHVSFDMITLMTDLSLEDLGVMAPSEISKVVDKCLEVNKGFFGMVELWQKSQQSQVEQ